MTTRERIFAEIERIDEDQLDALYAVIKQFTQTQTTKPSFMEKLKRVQIDAPEDFAANLDLYLSREQRAE